MPLAFPAVAATVLAFATADPGRFSDPPTVVHPRDFVEYWSAARVHLRGGDPYDGRQLLPLQREAAGSPFKSQPTMLWTPPYTLPLYLPFAPLEPRSAHLAWLLVQILCVTASAWLMWRVYDGPTAPSGLKSLGWTAVPTVILALFGPVWLLFFYGQNTGFILIGLAGFLLLRQKGYPFAAGLVGALTAVKPHLLALFGLAVLLDVGTRSGRRVLLGGAAAVLVGSAIALVPNPDVFSEFLAALTRPHSHDAPAVTEWQLPLISYRLRVGLEERLGESVPFWVQFLPVAAGCLALVPYWWARRLTWDWTSETPRLVLASLLLAPYGGWIFDLVLLLVPVMQAFVLAIRSGRLVPIAVAAGGYLALALVSTSTLYGKLHESIWFAPVVTGWYVVVLGLARDANRTGYPSA
jgi:hypothetical protein